MEFTIAEWWSEGIKKHIFYGHQIGWGWPCSHCVNLLLLGKKKVELQATSGYLRVLSSQPQSSSLHEDSQCLRPGPPSA